jgi:hypothetical protein
MRVQKAIIEVIIVLSDRKESPIMEKKTVQMTICMKQYMIYIHIYNLKQNIDRMLLLYLSKMK